MTADSDALRARRYRQCRRGDHSLCKVGRCPEAGSAATGDVRELARAVEREFVGDPVLLSTARRLTQLASGTGAAAVSALRALVDLVEAKRGRPFQPTDVLDAEVVALAEEIVEVADRQASERAEERVALAVRAAVGDELRGLVVDGLIAAGVAAEREAEAERRYRYEVEAARAKARAELEATDRTEVEGP